MVNFKLSNSKVFHSIACNLLKFSMSDQFVVSQPHLYMWCNINMEFLTLNFKQLSWSEHDYMLANSYGVLFLIMLLLRQLKEAIAESRPSVSLLQSNIFS